MSQEKGLPCLSSSCGMHVAPGPRWHTLSGGDTLTVRRQNSVLLKAWSEMPALLLKDFHSKDGETEEAR